LVPAVDVEKHGATPPQSDEPLHVNRLQPPDVVPESVPPDSVQVPPCVEFVDASHENVAPFTQPDWLH